MKEALKDYVAVAIGRMACNSDKVIRNPMTHRAQGKAILVDHYLFDQLWMSGTRKIPDKFIEESKEQIMHKQLNANNNEESMESIQSVE